MEENAFSNSDIVQSFNEVISKLLISVDNNVFKIMDSLVFNNLRIIDNENFQKIFNNFNGILAICNALILGIILFYAINYLFSHLFISKVDSPYQFIFKLIIFVILMNSSVWLCKEIIIIVDLTTEGIRKVGEILLNQEISFANLINNMNKYFYSESGKFDVLSFDGIIKTFVSGRFY